MNNIDISVKHIYKFIIFYNKSLVINKLLFTFINKYVSMSTNKELSQRFIKAIFKNVNIKQSKPAKIIKTNSYFKMATIASNTFSFVYDMNITF